MTLQDNIALALVLGRGFRQVRSIRKVQEFAEIFGLEEHLQRYPYRSFRADRSREELLPGIDYRAGDHFADEPTGASDSSRERTVGMVLKRVHEDGQQRS